MEKKKIQVVAAVIRQDGKYLCTQRKRSRLPYITEHWEFPGGKVKEGECHYKALIREIREEMDWDVFVGKEIATVEYEYPDFCVSLTAYLCKGGDEEFKLLEHLDAKWLTREEMDSLNWTAADRLIVEKL
ncbi:MAG: (deoxy)nucleoside triphosphate pyrophosphohydrolase [Prevotella sp.]|jgi:8-oxo-dGTP diphosphatase|nr:(deoxy)nucleoside triphosphate pyrophosphohydrolase [Prevotella sp.]